jgi:PilZ domain
MKPAKSWLKRLWSLERRKADRYRAPPLVAYYWDGAVPLPHIIEDISTTGLYLVTERRWYPGTQVMLTLQRTDQSTYLDSERSIVVQAKVVRWCPDGVGVEFVLPETEESRKEQALFHAADQKAISQFVSQFR